MNKTAVVIGAGMGGLAVSIRLALKGYAVTVYDRNPYPGGKLSQFVQDGFSFDAGPSLFTQPANIEDVFRQANERIEDYFTYESVPLACRYFFEDGTIINAWTDQDKFADELAQKNGEDPVTVRKYLARAEKAYKAIGTMFLDHSLHNVSTWLNHRILPAISATRSSYLLKSMHGYNRSAFRHARTVQIMDRFATYNGSDPYKAPAMLTMIPHLEQNEGTFYPRGGMISITNALFRLAVKKGVQFRLGAIVQKIMKDRNKACGVITTAGEHRADVVVSNMDVYYVYRDLLDDQPAATRVLKRERSSSALIFYWGINRNVDSLHLHNIFFSASYRAEFEHLFSKGTMFEDPTV
jgi:phytoene desaturase